MVKITGQYACLSRGTISARNRQGQWAPKSNGCVELQDGKWTIWQKDGFSRADKCEVTVDGDSVSGLSRRMEVVA
jgi:hypothetical protein